MQILFFAIIPLSVAFIRRHNARVQAQRDALATRQTYEHIACPILVTSNFPDDPTVNARAEAWRVKLRAAGNKYSESLPIIPYPFALGASPGNGILGSWSTYRANCILKEQAIRAEWEERIAKENSPLFNGHILGQSNN